MRQTVFILEKLEKRWRKVASARTRETCRGGWLAWPIDQHWWFLRRPYVIVVRAGSMPRHLEASLGHSVSIRDMWLEISFSDGRESLPRNRPSTSFHPSPPRSSSRIQIRRAASFRHPTGSFRVIGFFLGENRNDSCAVETRTRCEIRKGRCDFCFV